MAEMTKHSGGCYCGHVRYEVETDLARVMSCNCSICQKRGALWSFVDVAKFNLLSGDGDLADYQFNKKIIHHLFCRNCGFSSFVKGRGPDGSEMVGINVRCLDDIDSNALSPMPFDGKNL